jgi:thioredoxin 1
MNTEPATHQVVELRTADFDATIQNGVTLVDFWAPWCGPCRMQAPVLEQVAGRLAHRAKVAKVNVDEYPELANRFQITGIPTLLLFKQGRAVRQFVGVQTASVLVAALESVL